LPHSDGFELYKVDGPRNDAAPELYRLSFQLNGRPFTLNDIQAHLNKKAGLLNNEHRRRDERWFELYSRGFVLYELQSLLNEAAGLRYTVGLLLHRLESLHACGALVSASQLPDLARRALGGHPMSLC